MTACAVWHGYDYVTQQPVSRTSREWRVLIEQLKARGGRTVRNKRTARNRLGEDDLLLIEKGQIIAEVYDRD